MEFMNVKRIISSEYYQEWLEIANDPTTHIGENLKVNFLTSPERNTLEKELMD
jgi:hypothetical protein